MKKYFILALMGIFSLGAVTSCSDRNDDVVVTDYDTYSVVLDINNVNFANDPNVGYMIRREFTRPLQPADVVLIYRKAGASNGATVWQAIPRTVYLSGGRELDYDFDFSVNDIMIYVNGTYDLATTPEYINGQTFRVVLVPASAGKNANVDYSNYDSVIKHFNIDDSKVKDF